MVIAHSLSSSPRLMGLSPTSASSMNVSCFSSYVKAGQLELSPRGSTIDFQSCERTRTQVQSPSSSTGYLDNACFKIATSSWQRCGEYPVLQTKCCCGFFV